MTGSLFISMITGEEKRIAELADEVVNEMCVCVCVRSRECFNLQCSL